MTSEHLNQVLNEAMASHRLVEEAKKLIPVEEILAACRMWKDRPRPVNRNGNHSRALRQFEVKVGKAIIRQNGYMVFIGRRESLFKLGEQIQITCPEFDINFKTRMASNGLRFGKGSRNMHAFGGIVARAKLTPEDSKKFTFVFHEVSPGQFVLTLRKENPDTLRRINDLKQHRHQKSIKRALALTL